MKNTLMRSALCLLLLLALMAGLVYGVNRFSAPIVAENERLAAEAAAAAEKALLGDSVMLFDRADPAASTLEPAADTVQSVYRDLSLSFFNTRKRAEASEARALSAAKNLFPRVGIDPSLCSG